MLRYLLPVVLLCSGLEVRSVRQAQPRLLQQYLCSSRDLLPRSEARLLRTGPGLCPGLRRSGREQLLPGSGRSGVHRSRGLRSGLCRSGCLLPESLCSDLRRSFELL